METRASFPIIVVFVVLYSAHSQNVPPKLITPDTHRTYYKHEGGSITLQCHAEGTPEPTYRWRHFNGPVAQDVTVDETNGSLNISNFKDKHEGDYQCLAENNITGNVAVAMSAVTTLTKIRLGSDWPESSNVKVTSPSGGYAKLTCDNPPTSVPASQFSWYLVKKNDKAGQATAGQISNDERIHIDATGTLHFIYVQGSDEESEYWYKCGIHNSGVDVIKLGSEKDLTVTDQDRGLQQSKAAKQFYTTNAQFLRTKEAILECVYSGYPIPNITWFDKQNKLISNDEKFEIWENNRKLIIKDLQEEDEGLYTCRGSNFGSGEDGVIFLDVTSGPIWVESLRSQTVLENKDAVLTCKARPAIGDSELNPVVWYKNGGLLTDNNDDKYEFSDNSRVLTVKRLNKATDIMCFQCNVSNDFGYEFSDGCLNVIEPIVITVSPGLQHISKGDLVNLTVIGKTDPAYTLQYKWYFNGRIYENSAHPPFVIYNETTKHAYINTSDLNDEDYKRINGTYIRELYHKDDQLNVSVHVMLRELPAPVAVQPVAAAGFWWIAVVAAIAILLLVVILIAIVNRQQQKGTYLLDKRERANDLDPDKDIADGGFHVLTCAQDDDDYPTKPFLPVGDANINDDDNIDFEDDDRSLAAYENEDFDASKFNEDGSFLGLYGAKNKD